MGELLVDYYKQCRELGGTAAVVRLAGLVRVSSLQAAEIPDSAENIALFEQAFKAISESIAQKDLTKESFFSSAKKSVTAEENYTMNLFRICSDFMGQRTLFLNSIVDALQHITETCARGLNVSRAGIWLFENNKSIIRCVNLFDAVNDVHSQDMVLTAADFPSYFRALAEQKSILANYAQSDIRTSCFTESYLKPLGISSMLDVPIWVNGEVIGIICLEHIGLPRQWSQTEESFVFIVANFIAIVMEREALKNEIKLNLLEMA